MVMKTDFKVWLGGKLLPLVAWLLKEDAHPLKNVVKGGIGEASVQFFIWLGLDKKAYPRFHDITVPAKGGRRKTTQIDTVVVSRYGVFVVEVKNMKGTISVAEGDEYWMLNGKVCESFNPARQNRWHIKWLSELLELPEKAFESVVFFVPGFFVTEKCKFDKEPPRGVMNRGVIEYIRRFGDDSRLSAEQVRNVCIKLQKQQDENARERAARFQATMEDSARTCPQCNNGKLVKRTNKTGYNAGVEFWGCSNYPDCKYTE